MQDLLQSQERLNFLLKSFSSDRSLSSIERSQLSEAAKGAARLVQLKLKSLCDLKLIEKNHFRRSLTRFQVSKVLADITNMMQLQSKDKQVKVDLNCPPESDLYVEAD